MLQDVASLGINSFPVDSVCPWPVFNFLAGGSRLADALPLALPVRWSSEGGHRVILPCLGGQERHHGLLLQARHHP